MVKPRLLLLALALSAGAVFAGGRTVWQDGGVQLCGPSASTPMTATSDSSGGAIVVWEDVRQWPDGIYAQRVNGSGVPLWGDSGVVVDGSAGQGGLSVVDDGENGAIVVWGPSSSGASISVQRLGADGTPLWGANGLVLRPLVGSPPLDNVFAVAGDGHGGAIVAWTASVAGSNPLDTLIACRVDSSGTKRWETVVRIDTMNVDPPCLCPDGLGGVILEWYEYNGYSGHWAVAAQRVDSAGGIKWDATGVPVCTLTTVQYARGCVAVGESSFVVRWRDSGGGSYRCRAQMLDLAGNRLWGPIGVPVTGTSYPSSGGVALPTGVCRQSVWLWSENRTGTTDLFAQKLDSAGIRGWDSTGVWLGAVDTTGGVLSAATDRREGAIAAWTLYRSSQNWDVYAQHVDSAGDLCWSDTGLAVCAGNNNVRYPVAVIDGEGGAIIVWDDDRGLYAQRVADGPPSVEAPDAEVRTRNDGPTVIRRLLFLPEAADPKLRVSSLMDATGRKVMYLRPGVNDGRALAPGVYFVRQASGVKREAFSVAKVVLTE